MDIDLLFEIRKANSKKLLEMTEEQMIELAKKYIWDYQEDYYAYDALMDELEPSELAMTLNVDVCEIKEDMERRAEEGRRTSRQIENEYLQNAI